MGNPKISVVIPVYNSEEYLKSCVDSVLAQTFRDIEVILVDDGSKDQSSRICDEYQLTDNRVRVIHQSNAGQGNARNAGIKVASGEFISFVDSDDYIHTETYRTAYDTAIKEGADSVLFGYHRIKKDKILETRINHIKGTFRGREVFHEVFLNALGSEPSYPYDCKILWHSPCLCLYSLRLMREHNILFPSDGIVSHFGEDGILNLEYFIKASCVTVIDKPFYHYRENVNSVTHPYSDERFIKSTQLFLEESKRVRNHLQDEERCGKAIQRLQRMYLGNARISLTQISARYSYENACEHIRAICDNPTLQEVLSEYPFHKNPLKHRVVNMLLKKKRIWLIYKLASLKKQGNGTERQHNLGRTSSLL